MASSSNFSSPCFFVTQDKFKQFHSIDRELYAILAIHLCRDPVESMQVMALWLWLERVGYQNVVKKMLTLPYILISELADESVICLNIIRAVQFPPLPPDQTIEIPLLQTFMEKEFSIDLLQENRDLAARGVTRASNTQCLPAFDDIMKHAIERNFAQVQNPPPDHHSQVILPSPSPSPSPTSPSSAPIHHHQPSLVPSGDRTMFVTFSRGYPVHEHEVKNFFNSNFGDCVESLQMQEVKPYEQSLFARVIFHSAATIEAILNGKTKAKFTINGKHIWVRRFVPKRERPLLQPPPALPQVVVLQPIAPFRS